jgi:membrane associated rhomboid family serine protease
MILFPLGLNVRIFAFPWVTLVLALSIVICSWPQLGLLDQWSVDRLSSANSLQLIRAHRDLLAATCLKSTDISKSLCEALNMQKGRPVYNATDPIQKIEDLPRQYHITDLDKKNFSKILFDFEATIKKSAELEKIPEFKPFHEIFQGYNSQAQSFFSRSNLLSKNSITALSLLKAQFTHSGLLHLIGNLAFFIFLSVFVELRLGGFAYLLLYIGSGTLGLLVQLKFMNEGWTPLLGASANIAGVAGAFCVLFWKQNMKLWLSYFLVINRILFFPVYIFFPILVFAGDLAGLADSSSHIAHIAHLMGFACGALFAGFVMRMDPLPEHFLFFEELNKFQRAQQTPAPERHGLLLSSVSFNPENSLVHSVMLAEFGKAVDFEELHQAQKIYVHKYLSHYLGQNKFDRNRLALVANHGSPSWPLQEVFARYSVADFFQALDKVCHGKDFETAKFVSMAFLHKFPRMNAHPQFQLKYSQFLKDSGGSHVNVS